MMKAHIPPPLPDTVPLPQTPHPTPPSPDPVPPEIIEPPLPPLDPQPVREPERPVPMGSVCSIQVGAGGHRQ